MSDIAKDSRGAHTGIPRLKSSSKYQSTSEKASQDATGDCKQTGPGSNGRQKGVMSDSTCKGLSLQGPFNPEIVGRKQGDKRKKPEYNGGKFLSSVRSYEEMASKRSTQSEKEKQKFQRNFNNKAETKFAGGDAEEKKTVQFTAKGPTKMKGYRELKKSEDELQKKVLHLEVSLRDLDLLRSEEVTSLNKQLSEANEKAGTLEDDLNSMKEEYTSFKASSSGRFQEQEELFLKDNQRLQEKVDSCIRKLQQSNIDPVTLENMNINEQEVETKRQKAVEQARSLQQKLKELSEKNKAMMENIQLCMDGSS